MARILVTDDESEQAEILKTILASQGHQVAIAISSREALKQLSEANYDLLIADLRMPGEDGLSLLASARKEHPHLGVVMMTAYGSIESAVEAMKRGALDYIQKPFGSRELLLTVEKALERLPTLKESPKFREELATRFKMETIVGSHSRLQEVMKIVYKVAPTDATVLIQGESGTGKELVARAIHGLSGRRDRPFLPVNCSAIPDTLIESELFGYEEGAFTGARHRKPGLLELADKGTVFLDEISELDLAVQPKVLRVIQDRTFLKVGGNKEIRVDVRFIAATNKDLEQEMARGRFRDDLYYRLNVVSLTIPPLRERRSDIEPLANYFLERCSRTLGKKVQGISPDALEILMRYHWPGNVRQLGSVIERATIMCEKGMVTTDDLPSEVKVKPIASGRLALEIPEGGLSIEELEVELMTAAMERSGGVISTAASLLGMSYYTFYKRWKKVLLQKGPLPPDKAPLPKGK